VGGVQSQSITVDRQMDRYKVPRIAFINKCDRTGANPYRVVSQMREKLHLNAVLVELPIGLEDRLEGVVDLINMKAIYFDEPNGTNLRIEEVPDSMLEEAQQKREELIESASDFDDDLMNMILEGEEPSVEMIEAAIRRGTLSLKMCPVFVGSAHKNKGIQPLLDGVTKYLPEPRDVENRALDLDNNEQEVILEADDKKTPVVLAFKLEDGRYGQLTYIRVYQGKLRKGDELINTRTGKRFRIGRLIKMHASEMEDISECGAGEIAALFGIDCASGDTFCGAGLRYAMTSMYVPNPVISLAIHPKDKKSQDNMSKAINRFMKEDPTFQCYVDPESNQTIIKGMGELHLDVYVERMRREYNCEVTVGAPEVAYREAISQRAEFNYTHKKQTGGSGQFARVAGYIEPIITDPSSDEEPKDFEFINEVKGGAIPTEYIPSCEKGFQNAMKKGPQLEFPIVGVRVCINDGAWHPVDSSDMAFQTAAIGAFKEAFAKAKPIILEPIMKVEIEGPSEFQGAIFGTVNQRRGMIVSSTEDNNVCTVDAEVPLAEMFGYSTVLRSMTQGKAEFTMEVCRYAKVPQSIGEELKLKKEEKDKAKK
ncbi:MAG: elongation factor G, partial [Spirochaetales bacterium]|nr:elongation factor G [Spirochaetales bacterium]